MHDDTQYTKDRMYMVGYGTFITKGVWKTKNDTRICRVLDYRRVYSPRFAWFPFAIEDSTSEFLAVCFLVSPDNLVRLDRYEGVNARLYERIKCEIEVKDSDTSWTLTHAWMYVPTPETKTLTGFPYDDNEDHWLVDKIRMDDGLREEFPEFFEN